jgi:hypothetical protein
MKNHNNLADSQIHKPKGFAPARARSVSTKNSNNEVEWVKGNYSTDTAITCRADIAGDLQHRHITVYSNYDALKYAVYFQITAATIMATPSGYNGVIAVDVTASGSGSTSSQVSTALHTALNGHTDFTSTRSSETGVVTLEDVMTSTDVTDYSTGFSFSISKTEIINEMLITDSTGEMKWTPYAPLMGASSDKNYVHIQNVTSSVWVVTHNLDKYCAVAVVDSAGTVVIGQVDYNSLNQTTLTFKSTFSGKAYFN